MLLNELNNDLYTLRVENVYFEVAGLKSCNNTRYFSKPVYINHFFFSMIVIRLFIDLIHIYIVYPLLA